jgi:hypothetical protein
MNAGAAHEHRKEPDESNAEFQLTHDLNGVHPWVKALARSLAAGWRLDRPAQQNGGRRAFSGTSRSETWTDSHRDEVRAAG